MSYGRSAAARGPRTPRDTRTSSWLTGNPIEIRCSRLIRDLRQSTGRSGGNVDSSDHRLRLREPPEMVSVPNKALSPVNNHRESESKNTRRFRDEDLRDPFDLAFRFVADCVRRRRERALPKVVQLRRDGLPTRLAAQVEV